MTPQDIADRNVERLLEVAYKPEPVDPAFVRETEEKLLAAARLQAERLQPVPADTAKLARVRRRLSWAMAAAAAVIVVLLIGYSQRSTEPARKPLETASLPWHKDLERPDFKTAALGLTPKPLPESDKPQVLAVSKTLTTAQGERRRVALADGSILFVNENTTLMHAGLRHLRLGRGEIYVEVAPKAEADRFIVETEERLVTALGTHFHVAATADGVGVLVTQGKVKVSDVPEEIPAGQQVAPGSKKPATAPRASHVLDWLKPLVADASLVPSAQHEGGALVAVDPNGQELQLTLRKYHIDVHIEDGFARTTIDQTYFNNTWSRLEGTFYFPLPPDASLSRLAMYVLDGNDQKLMEGGMAERDHARNAFETIRYERRDPALLEWVDSSTFKMRVFPLEAWQEKRIILSYTQRLPSLYGVSKYRFPGGHNMQVVRDWSFAATVANPKDWQVLCPSHPGMKQESNEKALVLQTEARAIKPEQDVVLELREREAPPGGATFADYVQDGQRYFMARYRPKLDTKPARQRRDWIVLFETSANRDPLLARTQIEVFRNLLRNAEYEDTFTLLTVNTRATSWSAKPQAVTPENISAAVEYLEKTHLIGGCDLEKGLRQALDVAKITKNPHLVHLGAGVPSLGEVKDDLLAKLVPENVPYIGVGVGKKWNRAFMKMAAEHTGGYFTQINPDEPVAWRAFDLLATLNTPRLLDVHVIDPDEKATYLTDAVTLAEGEEICAFTRGPSDSLALPKKVLITGRLNGKPFHRELAVPEQNRPGILPHGAAYIPRTWAKLEIDRLVADGQDKNKAKITELSKAMYVMSPFTSLLVLENDADYQRFNIDRGRKDHWAMYPCPERIPRVYEPDPAYQRWWRGQVEQSKDGTKPSTEQVLDTILMRLPPHYIYANGRQSNLPPVATARQVLLAAYAVPLDEGHVEFERLERLSEDETRLGDLGALAMDSRMKGLTNLSLDFGFPAPELAVADMKNSEMTRLLRRSDLLRERLAGSAGGLARARGIAESGRVARGSLLATSSRNPFFAFQNRKLLEQLASRPEERREAAESMPLGWALGNELDDLSLLEERIFTGEAEASRPRFFRPQGLLGEPRAQDFEPAFRVALRDEAGKNVSDRKARLAMEVADFRLEPMLSSLDGVSWSPRLRENFADLWILSLAEQVRNRQSASFVAYTRPQHQIDQRLFGDLTIQAPGLYTTWADIQTVLEQEAKQERPAVTGKIDAAARALLDKTRQAPWQAVVYPGVGRIPGFDVIANGQGQFFLERVLSSGLHEQVVCDGATLWHVYPDIGLATRRPLNRFRFGQIAQWVPWLLPKAEDLARNADLVTVDATTVAIVPHEPPTKSKDDKAKSTRQLHLVFAGDGLLSEKRVVEMPAGKVLLRQTFDAQGNVRIVDDSGKEVAARKFARRDATAPNLTPQLNDLVVLDMPLRTGVFAHNRLEKHQAEAKGEESLLQRDRIALFAAACFSRDRDPLPMFGAYFHAKGDKRLGFYTLLSAGERHFLGEANTWFPGIAVFDPVQEHPQSPLARYLAYHQKGMQPQYNADADFLENLPGRPDGFVARLAAFRNAWNAWRHYLKVGSDPKIYEREKGKLLDFLRINTDPLLAFILQSNTQHLNSHDRATVSKLIYESQKDYVHPLGLGYVLGYDAAYQLYYKGDYQEAARLFRELHQNVVKEGALPKIDGVFRAALDDTRNTGPHFGEFLRGVVQDYLQKEQPHFALLAALQASYVNDPTLGDELFQHIQQHLPKNADRLVTLASLEYVLHNRIDSRADALRDRLLADKGLAAKPGVWRLSAALAQQRGQPARAVADLEKALDLEYQHMPDLINLEAVRTDYRLLLSQYWEIAKAAQTLEQAPPKDLLERVVRAADRWRALDSQAGEVCERAAAILKMLGAKELAWDYETTPIALRPNEAAPWLDLAKQLRESGDLEQADDAYARAYRSESTNPQILWDRAQNLLQLGRVNQARDLWRQIAEGTWQPRFQTLVPQARWHLEHN